MELPARYARASNDYKSLILLIKLRKHLNGILNPVCQGGLCDTAIYAPLVLVAVRATYPLIGLWLYVELSLSSIADLDLRPLRSALKA